MHNNNLLVSLEEFGHIPRKVGTLVQQRINTLKIGQKMQDLPEDLWHKSFKFYVKEDPERKGGPNMRLIRLDPEKPSLTVTGFIFNKFVHPYEDRYITPREAARLQGFPDDFLFHGSLTSIQRQVGNAVPVQLAKAAAQQVLEHIKKHHPMGLGIERYEDGCYPSISLFSGAGGMDLGVLSAKAGKHLFDVRACVEYDADCCSTLQLNFPDRVNIIHNDISNVDPKALAANMETEDMFIPLIVGGPPCQAFSQAGKQMGIHDPRGLLIFEFLRFIRELQPVYFIMENVSNLKGVENGELLSEIEEEIDKIGYNFSFSLLCAADYGAPQLRKRIIFIGVRKPYPAVQPPFPTHCADEDNLFCENNYVGVGKAFEGLPNLAEGTQYDKIVVKSTIQPMFQARAKANKFLRLACG
jgi:DNA (cytosine-5)-methyltransferase 1